MEKDFEMIHNRELSWLVFNERVLQEAQDLSVPLMQRLRFLGIFSNNQDEFIKVRVANLIRMAEPSQRSGYLFTGGYSASELLPLVTARLNESKDVFDSVFYELMDEIRRQGIVLLNERQLSKEQEGFAKDYFSNVISQRIVPLIVKKSADIPFLEDENVYFAVKMERGNSVRNVRYAIIRIPTSSACPRLVVLPSQDERKEVMFIDDIIRLCLDEIFFMFKYDKISAHTFKFLRDAQLMIEDDASKSLIEKMEEGLDNRLHGRVVRIVYDADMPCDVLDLISSKLGMKDLNHIVGGGRYHMLRDLMKFPLVRPDLESQNPEPIMHKFINPHDSLLKVIKNKDILLCYPYHTFKHFIDFLREAAIDPQVERICITLYRTADRSKVINALVNAVKNGKEVIATVELMARFDEEQNVANTDVLQRAGVKVIHGSSGLKVHSKLVLVERREGTDLRGYIYVGTGNFNENTAKIYSDFGLFTTDKSIAKDVKNVFDFLVNNYKHYIYHQLWVSPYNMRSRFERLVEREIANAEAGRVAYLDAKFNSLTDVKMVNLLCKAANSGVKIRLIVRGQCCLNSSEIANIEIISIVDKYLEHARMAIFANDGDEEIFILSADLMTRNLDRRVEVGVPIKDGQIKRLLRKYFDIQFSDNVKARDLSEFGANEYVKVIGDRVRSQDELYNMLKN